MCSVPWLQVLNAYLDFMTELGVLLGSNENLTRVQMEEVLKLETEIANVSIPFVNTYSYPRSLMAANVCCWKWICWACAQLALADNENCQHQVHSQNLVGLFTWNLYYFGNHLLADTYFHHVWAYRSALCWYVYILAGWSNLTSYDFCNFCNLYVWFIVVILRTVYM